jgi:hypothetical protein
MPPILRQPDGQLPLVVLRHVAAFHRCEIGRCRPVDIGLRHAVSWLCHQASPGIDAAHRSLPLAMTAVWQKWKP